MGEIHPAPIQFSAAQLEADPILRYFHYAHLPEGLRRISSVFCGLAVDVVENVPRNAERTVALRKLLEAKDAAVRANVPAAKPETFETRLVAEHRELSARVEKLSAFIDGDGFTGIPEPQRRLLIEQRTHMDNYRQVLDERMAGLGLTEPPGFEHEAGGRVTGEIHADDPPLHRIGQERKVNARFISLANSIDEVVSQTVARKTAAIASIENYGEAA